MNEIDKIRLKEAFLLMDEDNSGVITINDVHFLIRALGFTPTENDLKKIDMEFSINRNIDYLWFIDIMSTISCTKYSYEQIENAFLAFDQNRYGKKETQIFFPGK
jgi:Ca2+-binding EF-hand superfamily protein